MRRVVIAVALVFLSTPIARAAEPTPGEEKFLKSLVDALTNDSHEVRLAAEEALVAMGGKAATYLVTNMRRVRSEAQDAVERTLVRIGQPTWDAIEGLDKRPGGKAGELLDRVEAALKGAGGIGGFGEPDPTVESKVRAILSGIPAGSFSSDDPSVDKLVELGRPAIPSLISRLRPSKGFHTGFENLACTYALGRICGPQDTLHLGQLLDQGWLEVAAVMKEVGDPACVPVLIRALDAGRMSSEVGDAVRSLKDPRTRIPVIRFLERYGDSYPNGTSDLLDLVVEFQATEAIPIIKRIAKSESKESLNRNSRIVWCCRALVSLGDPAGFPPLIASLSLGGQDEWLVNWAGETLNDVTGQNLWRRGMDGAEARAQYSAWYEQVKGSLAWDPGMGQFLPEK